MKNKNLKRFLSLTMSLRLAFAMMTVASASNEATASGGSATSQVTLSSTADGSLDGDPAATAMSVTVPTVLPIAVGTDGSMTTATDAKITNNSYGAVKVSGVSIQAAQGWHLTDFETNMANEKVDSNQVGFALTIGGGEQLATDSTEAPQALHDRRRRQRRQQRGRGLRRHRLPCLRGCHQHRHRQRRLHRGVGHLSGYPFPISFGSVQSDVGTG